MRTIGVAIAIPEPWGGELQRYRKAFGDPLADAIPTHVTLVPPTAVDDDALAQIEEHLRVTAAQEEPFDLHLRGTGTFRPVSPVVFVQLALGISAIERIEELVRRGPLARELSFPFHPHVTVAHDLPEEALDRAYDELATYEARFVVWGFSLYEHGPDGVWRPQRDFVLGRQLPGPGLPAEGVGAAG
ncbi:2'-5' RNA ligase family protein [Motilibacter aurantiacus]|uniref:2'-5' RNA ligase family protein n=1 Tax=Motilibacter aurantiacus TaxID=2714955 RepID=UPI00140B9858|nr:2'-5' RNA ligase family protein [Motilibacter aurantiacus]NHC43935.1 2'-5' RNA ligase family protein [Motilibacter aurantiacus]